MRINLRIKSIIMLVFFLTVSLSWFWTASAVQDVRRNAELQAFAKARSLSRLLTIDWAQMYGQVKTLQRIGEMISVGLGSGDPTSSAMTELKQVLALVGPEIVQVAGIGANGIVSWSTLPVSDVAVNLSDREHFRAITVDGKDSFTGTPVVGKVSGLKTVQMASAARYGDGSLAGVVVVSVNDDMLRDIARTLAKQDGVVFCVIRNDGELLMRSESSSYPKLSSGQHEEFKSLFLSGGDQKLLRSPVDGVRRFYAREAVPGTDMIMSVGVDEDEALEGAKIEINKLFRQTFGLDTALAFATLAALYGVRRSKELVEERIRSAEVEEREVTLRHFADAATDIIALLDAQFNYIYVNNAVEKTLGVSPHSLIGHMAGSYVLEDDQHIMCDMLDGLLKGIEASRVITRMRHADGSMRWLEHECVSVQPLNNNLGSALRYISISRDITDRKLAENSLDEANENLRAMLQASQGLLCQDWYPSETQGRLSVVGEYTGAIFGRSKNEVESEGFIATVLAADSVEPFDAMKKKCFHEGYAIAELKLEDANGKWRWMRIQCTKCHEEANKIKMLYYMVDITEEYKRRGILQQVERLAVIGEVSANIAHELNQPLAVIAMAAINGMDELDVITKNGAKVASKFKRIEKQTRRISKVVNHIRAFSRATLDGNEAVSISELINEAIEIAYARISTAGVEVIVDIPSSIPSLQAPRLLLEQVLVNLIVNSCDAYLEGQKRLHGPALRLVNFSARPAAGECIIKVVDHAGGIPAAKLNEIFNPFFTTKSSSVGSGLGLSFCATVMKNLGGNISARNDGDGAVFELHIPYSVAL